jgi:Protein of unknown function (DUF1481).
MARSSSSPATRLRCIVTGLNRFPDSDALRQGRVELHQGSWHKDGTVTTCEGQTIKPKLDSQAISYIERRQSQSSKELSVAWLAAPEGSQLLLVANEDFCSWQPKAKTF